MSDFLLKNLGKLKLYIILTIFLISSVLLGVAYKNNESAISINVKKNYFDKKDFELLKEFLVRKINSPYINVDYKIKKGDTLQKILQSYKVANNQINSAIQKFKKYHNPNNLIAGRKISIIVKKNLSGKGNSLIKLLIPITKSTSVEVKKNDENKNL